MYRVLQTTGQDGKNLLKLLPIPKASGSFVPIVQPPAMANDSKASVSSPVHLTFKTQLGNTTAPSSVKIPVFQSPSPGKIILARTLDKEESLRAGSDKESLTPNSGANSQSSCISVDKLSLQYTAVSSSSNQGNTAYMVLNPKTLPVAFKVSSLPSGLHLQIPADAEVKSMPASFLPPAVQQKILGTPATNVAGRDGGAKIPTVIYVSPVKTVKTALTSLRAVRPKPAPDGSQTWIMTATQIGSSPSPGPVTSDGQQCQQTPVKWVVQEGSQSPMPCLIPVKSSNNLASKILKTLSDVKHAEVNSANILPLCSSGAGGSQTKTPLIRDNALVMYNGKVYLLTKRSSDILSGQADNQAPSSSDVSVKKETSTLIDSTAVSKITSEVMNLMLSTTSGMVLSPKDPNPSPDSSPSGLRNDVKSAPAAPVTPSANQQDSTVNHRKSLLCDTSVSSGVTPVRVDGAQENMCPNGKEKTHSPKAARAGLLQVKQEDAFSEGCQKIQCGKMDSPRKLIQIKQQEKPHWKQYLELRKKFGLSKEERVYLKRIPLRSSCEELEERVCSSNSLKRKSDSVDSSLVDVETTKQHQECVNEEKKTVTPQEDLTKKRKVKSSATGKRRKTSVKSTTGPSSENTSSSSSVHSRSPSPPQVLLQQSITVSSLGRDSEQDLDSQYSDIPYSCIPVLVSSEDAPSILEGSFRNDAFPLTPPDLDETIQDERIERLKQQLREREAALEEMRRKMQQS
ncbi:ligand-dependent nuclear receptor-interacting factor 1 [Melopsittacus undulatus]|uniref:ligand-dependent nuclear receptor-interacting factor 1 n=1 Tax=Melopsittacus undulatus TaxID=13146 RepID=UPI00146BCE75|nr:ligand-dependent nuclear receptor-interacting factor 1 [Melopsittacus undulatus]XP_033925747.1 ligand-dependent nuclear receptor-interacting factor 1 [Melopsittacus undulatus]XP_033925748.1 ligand-dependent nuclear receptor-interacting factor 1 [Melopsittacus undulatus]